MWLHSNSARSTVRLAPVAGILHYYTTHAAASRDGPDIMRVAAALPGAAADHASVEAAPAFQKSHTTLTRGQYSGFVRHARNACTEDISGRSVRWSSVEPR